MVENPRWFETMQKRLRRAQRKRSRRKKYSKRWRKAAQYVVQILSDIANQRRDFQHKLSREIVNANGFIAVEDLNINGLASGMLAKSVADVGWSSFLNMLSYKAESAGRQLVRVDPRGTSQRCPCGKPHGKFVLTDDRSMIDWGAFGAPRRVDCDDLYRQPQTALQHRRISLCVRPAVREEEVAMVR
jgi:IS605 OrfB family transposase